MAAAYEKLHEQSVFHAEKALRRNEMSSTDRDEPTPVDANNAGSHRREPNMMSSTSALHESAKLI